MDKEKSHMQRQTRIIKKHVQEEFGMQTVVKKGGYEGLMNEGEMRRRDQERCRYG